MNVNPRYSWSRVASHALRHTSPEQKYDLFETKGGFCLMALTSGDLWFLPAGGESYAMDLADPIIYPRD